MAHLLVAINDGNERVVEGMVVQQKGLLNSKDADGNTPLHFSVLKGLEKMCKVLLDHGADVTTQNAAGYNPLHCACQVGATECLRHLLARPESFTSIYATTVHDRSTPLHLAADTSCSDASLNMTRQLVARGAVLTFRDSFGNTPLLRAVQARNFQTFAYLLEQSADVCAVNRSGMTALHYAAKAGLLDVAMQCGVRVDVHGRVDKAIRATPLHLAAAGGFGPIIEYLASRGVPIDLRSSNGLTALHIAAGLGAKDAVKALLQARAEVEARDEKNRTPLFRAVLCGSAACVELLLQYGAHPSPDCGGQYIPLHYACMRRDREVLSLLLAHPLTSVTQQDAGQHTALHWAALEGDKHCVEALLAAGADIHAKDCEGHTPASVAGLRGHTELAEMLHSRAGTKATRPARFAAEQLTSYWIADRDASACRECAARFTFLFRRHHCRYCRRIFCNNCSSRRLAPPHAFANIRLCNGCHAELSGTSSPSDDAEFVEVPPAPPSPRATPTNTPRDSPPALPPPRGTSHASLEVPSMPGSGLASGTVSRRISQSDEDEQLPALDPLTPLPRVDLALPGPDARDGQIAALMQQLKRWAQVLRDESDSRNAGFQEQFEQLCGVGVMQLSDVCDAHRSDNRYADIVAYDWSLVPLLTGPAEYINANFIPGFNGSKDFIATQGPLPTTVAAFWQMVWEHRVPLVVMVTGEVENGRTKCARYWPVDPTISLMAGPYRVSLVDKLVTEAFVLRRLRISYAKERGARIVMHCAFTEWPDHGTPASPEKFLQFYITVKALRQQANEQHKTRSPTVLPALGQSPVSTERPPIVVHCSAGVGRTGTFIATDWLFESVRAAKEISVFQVVRQMREARNYMVQTLDQYIFVHTLLVRLLRDRLSLLQDPPPPPLPPPRAASINLERAAVRPTLLRAATMAPRTAAPSAPGGSSILRPAYVHAPAPLNQWNPFPPERPAASQAAPAHPSAPARAAPNGHVLKGSDVSPAVAEPAHHATEAWNPFAGPAAQSAQSLDPDVESLAAAAADAVSAAQARLRLLRPA